PGPPPAPRAQLAALQPGFRHHRGRNRFRDRVPARPRLQASPPDPHAGLPPLIMRIVAAMSGGVDSSVAAALLADQGHEVIGLSMQLYDQSNPDRAFGSCCSLADLHDARRVAAAIRIPHYIMNFERQFDERVIANFVA